MSAARPRTQLRLETLEERAVPAVTATLNDTTLMVAGDAADNRIVLRQMDGRISVSGVKNTFPVSQVEAIIIEAGGGNDLINARNIRIGVTIYGGPGDDIIHGSPRGDFLYGGDGNDRIFGYAGNDVIHGDAGNDRLFGMGGVDELYGGDDNDWLDAGSRDEVADGGAGRDWNARIWAIDGTSHDDVRQNGAGTCVFLSTLAAVADQFDLSQRITFAGRFQYNVKLFYGGRWVSETVRFDGSMVKESGGQIVDAFQDWNYTEGEFWMILYQRAYLQRYFGINPYNGNAVANFPGEYNGNRAFLAITGTNASTSYTANRTQIANALAAGKVVTCGIEAGANEGHAYQIRGIYESAGVWRVELYNPWYMDTIAGNVVPFNTGSSSSDGVINVAWTDFAKVFIYVTIGQIT